MDRWGFGAGSRRGTVEASLLTYYVNGMSTIRGHAVSEQQVDAWVDEAEAGYDVKQLRKRGRPARGSSPAQVVPVRFTGEELAALTARAEREHLNRSEAIRQAVQEWARP